MIRRKISWQYLSNLEIEEGVENNVTSIIIVMRGDNYKMHVVVAPLPSKFIKVVKIVLTRD